MSRADQPYVSPFVPRQRRVRDLEEGEQALKSPHAKSLSESRHDRARKPVTPVEDRETQLALYRAFLETTVSNRGRPYAFGTINSYCEAVRTLGLFLTANDFPDGFELLTFEELNGYLAAWRAAHGQGGVVSKQSNLRVFFAWLSENYGTGNPYLDRRRNVYRREDIHPETLSDEFIDDLLAQCSGKGFAALRDSLIIRLFLVGPRNCEVQDLDVDDLDLRTGLVSFAPFKFAVNRRVVPIPVSTRQTAAAYLRVRAAHKSRPGVTGPLFINQLRGDRLSKSGLAQMLKRRAAEAGYDPAAVHPHLFRHTAADRWLADEGSEGDALHLFGWSDGSRSMLDRYGRANRARRAVRHAQDKGFGEPQRPGG